MITLSSAELNTWIAAFLWPLTRIMGLIATAPLFGNVSVPARTKIVLGVAIAVGFGVGSYVVGDSGKYVSANPSMTQTFVGVPNEQSILELCYKLQGVQGVIGVSYRDYSADEHSAVVTVYFNPFETSPRQLRIFFPTSSTQPSCRVVRETRRRPGWLLPSEFMRTARG